MLELLISQKNSLYMEAKNRGFSRSDFEWEEIKSKYHLGNAPALRHSETGFQFVIEETEYDYGEKGFLVRYSPGKKYMYESAEARDWDDVVDAFNIWLENVRRETAAPDLWEAVAGDNQLISDAEQQPADNIPFTEEELPRVREALAEIKAYILETHELSEAQSRIIDARFEYLEQKAERFGRKDWLHIVISILLSIGADQLRSGEGTQNLFIFAREVFRQLLGTVLYLSGPH